jgi:hypothetical protein
VLDDAEPCEVVLDAGGNALPETRGCCCFIG